MGIGIYRWKVRAVLLMALTCMVTPIRAESKQIVGWIEHVFIDEAGFSMEAKIDTGADNSSINAREIDHYVKDGNPWVRFSLKSKDGKTIQMNRQVLRTTYIKTKCMGKQPRPVIRMNLCLGGVHREVDVNLVDRSHFKYQLLIGRSFMRDTTLVDSEHKFLNPPRCHANTGVQELAAPGPDVEAVE